MKKKIYSLMLIFSMIAVFIPAEPAAAQDIKVGEYIKFGRYLGEPILWRCVAADENDHGPLILSDKIITIRPFDSQGGQTEGSHGRGYGANRKKYGSNYWGDSNIRSWLNSSAQAGYVDWECGNPPEEAKYAGEAGFLANFTSTEKKSIQSAQQKSLLDGYEYDSININPSIHLYKNAIDNVLQNYDNAYSEEVNDLIFLLDIKQIYTVYDNFKDETYYIGTLTEKAAAALNPPIPTSEPVTTPKTYKAGDIYTSFLRSPRAGHGTAESRSIQVRYVTEDGKINSTTVFKNNGIRPAFYLDIDSTTFASGSGTEEDPYVIAMGEDDSPINQPLPTSSPSPSPSPSPDEPTQEPTNVPSDDPTSAPSDTPTSKPTVSNSPTPTLNISCSKSISPIGKYADKMAIDMKAENNQILFTVTSSDISDLSDINLFIASYDSGGSLKSVSIGDNSLSGDKLTILADIYSTGTYKLVLMDNELNPLMKSETIKTVITIMP